MKKLLLFFFLIHVVSLSYSQQKNNNQKIDYKQIYALRKSYITEKIALTPEQSKKFWPVYNKYRTETSKLNKERNLLQKGIKFKDLSEEQADVLLNQILDKELKLVEARMDLSKNLKTIIRPKQILRLKMAEINFKKKLLEHINKKKKKQQN
ncbi:hypothetical protein [Ochrovirga pacifica]|uniref:hypothetical protein n=1 Tax=Ochrovirga pacifica TaxID=1042376 RepID=UPI00025591D7|nr:hypothetical protein [Ochrovirga pacifica]